MDPAPIDVFMLDANSVFSILSKPIVGLGFFVLLLVQVSSAENCKDYLPKISIFEHLKEHPISQEMLWPSIDASAAPGFVYKAKVDSFTVYVYKFEIQNILNEL